MRKPRAFKCNGNPVAELIEKGIDIGHLDIRTESRSVFLTLQNAKRFRRWLDNSIHVIECTM